MFQTDKSNVIGYKGCYERTVKKKDGPITSYAYLIMDIVEGDLDKLKGKFTSLNKF